MLNSKQIFFLIVLSIFIVFLLSLFTLYDSPTTGLVKGVIRHTEEYYKDIPKEVDPQIVPISKYDDLLEKLSINKYNINDIPINELEYSDFSNYFSSFLQPDDSRLIITVDTILSPDHILSEDITITYDTDKPPHETYNFCFVDPSIPRLSFSNNFGGPDLPNYNFNQLIDFGTKVESIFVVIDRAETTTLFKGCNLAPSGSTISRQGFFDKNKYEDITYNNIIQYSSVFSMHDFSLFNYILNPFNYSYERGELNLYNEIIIIINLSPSTTEVTENPTDSKLDMLFSFASSTFFDDSDISSYNTSKSFNDILNSYPNISNTLISKSILNGSDRSYDPVSGSYSDHLIIVGDLESGETADDLISVAENYFSGAKFVTMYDIINHNWEIQDNINNFYEMDSQQKDLQACMYFYDNEQFGVNMDRIYDPASDSDDFVKVDFNFDLSFDSDDTNLSFNNINFYKLNNTDLFGIPYDSLQTGSSFPPHTLVELYFIYENNLRDVQGQPFYHPSICLGNFNENGWYLDNVPLSYNPLHSQTKGKYHIRTGVVPLYSLSQVNSCIRRAGGDSIKEVKSGRAFIINPDTFLFNSYFGQPTGNEDFWYIINEYQYSNLDFQICNSYENNKSYGPFNLRNILGKTYYDRMDSTIKNFKRDDSYGSSLKAIKDIDDLIKNTCNEMHKVWDENKDDGILYKGGRGSTIDWCEVDIPSTSNKYYFVNSGLLTCLNQLLEEEQIPDTFEFYNSNKDGVFFCSQPYFSASPATKLRNYLKYEQTFNDISDVILLGNADVIYLMSSPTGIEDRFEAVPFKNLYPVNESILYGLQQDIMNNYLSDENIIKKLKTINSNKTSSTHTSLLGLYYYFDKKTGNLLYGSDHGYYGEGYNFTDSSLTLDDKFAIEAAKFCDPFQRANRPFEVPIFNDKNYSQISISEYELLYGPDMESKYFNIDSNITPTPSDYYYRSLDLTNYNLNYCIKETTRIKLSEEDSLELYETYYQIYSEVNPLLPRPGNLEITDKVEIVCNSCVLRTRLSFQDYLDNDVLLGFDHIFGLDETRENLKNVQRANIFVSRIPVSSTDDFINWKDNINLFKKHINSNPLPITKPTFYFNDFDVPNKNFLSLMYNKSNLNKFYDEKKFNTPAFMDFRIGYYENDHNLKSPYLDFVSLYQRLGLSNINVFDSHSNRDILYGLRLRGISQDIVDKYQETIPAFHFLLGCKGGDYTRVRTEYETESKKSYNNVNFGLFKTKLMTGMIGSTNLTWYSYLISEQSFNNQGKSEAFENFFYGRSNQENKIRFLPFLNTFYNQMYLLEAGRSNKEFLSHLYGFNYYGDPRLMLNLDTDRISRNYSLDLLQELDGPQSSKIYKLEINRNNPDNLYMLKAFICANDSDEHDSFDYSSFECGQYDLTRSVYPPFNYANKNCYPLHLSHFDTSILTSGYHDNLLDPSIYSNYDQIYTYLNDYPSYSKHFSVPVGVTTNSRNSYCYHPTFEDTFKSNITEIQNDVGLLFDTWRNGEFRRTATTKLDLKIPESVLQDELQTAHDFLSQYNYFDELNIVFTVESLGSSGTINKTDMDTQYGYYNCDYFQEPCASRPDCGVTRSCISTVAVGSNLLDQYQID